MTEQAEKTRGVLYAASGAAHVAVAARSARSVRKNNPGLGITLFSDSHPGALAEAFDTVEIIDKGHSRSKVDVVGRTPYDETLMLDNDTLVRADLSDMFDLLARFDIAIAGVYCWDRPTHQKTANIRLPHSFVEPNTGVVLFRKSDKMLDFMEKWRAAYHDFGSSNDQITMRELLWSQDVAYYVLPQQYNKRVFEASELIYTDQPAPRILHLTLLRPQKSVLMRWLADRIRY